MKRWIALIVMALAVGITSALATKPQNVTLVVDDVPVTQVLQALAEQEQKNLVVSPDVSGVLSLHLTDVPWKQALQTVVKSAGLVLRQEGNVLHVHSVQWQSENAARQDNEQARIQASMPLEQRSKAYAKYVADGGKPAPAATEAASESNDRLAAMMRRSARREEAYVPTSQLRRFTLPDSAPIMRRVMGFLSDQARTLIHAGVSRDRICIDPGPGFGKSANEDIVIQRETAKMASLGYPLMCAVSRKRFVGAVSGVTEAAERDAATFGVCLGAIQAGANIVRVHDAAGFAQFLNGYWAVAKPQPRRAFVAVGSNLGHRCDNIRAAREMIAEIPLTCVSNSSKIYESEPAYETRQDAFANAVIEIKTELAPLVLLDELMKIEAELGRDRSKKAKANGPRTIDLDLLWMDGETHGGKKLRLPHPLIGERDFVLVPLEDLMHDPARFFRYNGVEVKEPEDRVGHIVGELGRM